MRYQHHALLGKVDCHSREMIALGIKGAALAAFGEMPAGFLTVAFEPFGDRKEGVKLGESTFSAFLDWLSKYQHRI